MPRAHGLADEQDLIPGIFNYCDRWCERCAFTSRCRVFASERARAVDESAETMADAIEVVKDSFAEAKQMLIAHAEEMGIDLEAAMNDPEIDASLERQRSTVENDEAFKLASAYAMDSRRIFERAAEWLLSDHDPMIGEMVEILQWYQFFISAKIHRGLHGILDLDGHPDNEQLTDTQSDANGSIKIALIAIERSLLAWTYLLNNANGTIIRPEIDRLETVRSLVEKKFPNAREFIRPGFDEIGTVM
jgi:hypothetical protein